MEWTDGVTLGLAVLGAGLGVFNALREIYRDKVRLRVTPVWMTQRATIIGSSSRAVMFTRKEDGVDRNPNGWIGVQVINTGFVEVTIDSVGFTPSGFLDRHRPDKFRARPIISDFVEAATFPVRLPPRTSVTIWSSARHEDLHRALKGVTRAYAETACEVVVFGRSPLLRRLVAQAEMERTDAE